MNYFSELSERLFIHKVDWLKKHQATGSSNDELVLCENKSVSRRLNKPVLYEEDAYEVLHYWVNRISPEKLHPGPYSRESKLLKLACDSRNVFYWLYFNDGLYYAVRIGVRSVLSVGLTSYIPYCEIGRGHNDVEVEINGILPEIDGKATLFVKFVYDENGMQPSLLLVKGYDIHSINKAPWNSEVQFFDLDALREKRYDVMGRRGEWYEVWYNDLDDEVYRGQHKPDDGGTWIHDKWWKGEKIICQFFSVERPNVQEMLAIWDNFRRNV